MEWWQWVLASIATLLVLAIFAIRFDTLKDRKDGTPGEAMRRLAPFSPAIPVAFVVALVSPWWVGLIVVAIPALVLLVLASAS